MLIYKGLEHGLMTSWTIRQKLSKNLSNREKISSLFDELIFSPLLNI